MGGGLNQSGRRQMDTRELLFFISGLSFGAALMVGALRLSGSLI
jgi:hypothetical protein